VGAGRVDAGAGAAGALGVGVGAGWERGVLGVGVGSPKPSGNSDSGPPCANTGMASASALKPASQYGREIRTAGLFAELVSGHRQFDLLHGPLATVPPGEEKQQHDEERDDPDDQRQRMPAAAEGIVTTDFHDDLFGPYHLSRGRGRTFAVASGVGGCIAAQVMGRNDKYAQEATRTSLVLVGLMGVGKSTIGRRLAARLALPFVDADDEIERAAGMSIQEIFDTYGEAQFRDGERRVIARLIDGTPKVIATGGGAFVNDDTRRLILDKATAIWLDANIEILVERVSRRDGRPLLKDRDPREVLTQLASKRAPFYAQAPIRIMSSDSPHDATVEKILKAIGQ